MGPTATSRHTDVTGRVIRAALETAALHGYAGASVARVVERAGVSRASFYSYFCNREDCFLAAYRDAVSRIVGRLKEAASSVGRDDLPRALLRALAEFIVEDPPAARFVLIEALGADPAIRAAHERLLDEVRGEVEALLDRQSGGETALHIPAVALLGGTVGTISTSLLTRGDPPVPSDLEDLLCWVRSFARAGRPPGPARWTALGEEFPPPVAPAVPAPALLPRGRNALSPGLLADARRSKILDATVRTTAAKGYRDLTVADIVGSARVTRGAFYSHFTGKRDAFIAAQALGLQQGIAASTGAYLAARGDWRQRVWAAAAALLEYAARNPELAALGFVETYVVGEEAMLRQHDARRAYAIFLEEGYRCSEDRLPRSFSDATSWAVFALIRRQLVVGRGVEMLQILPQVAYVALAPFTGPAEAMAFVEARARGD